MSMTASLHVTADTEVDRSGPMRGTGWLEVGDVTIFMPYTAADAVVFLDRLAGTIAEHRAKIVAETA